ncbi:MAG: aldehyde dehydrogenase family protein [Elusimicrobia bacterium]|nr:aldehyde dehydrogenase family protein [Elusimicrobiota bacterium]MBK7687872.1 aldehyde dehydrogenase family protein [Elusimicrobiota bacterium]MBK8125209.1 aldehyde dehydrogenase family protein [Elusimicrobiota bacterium]MBK8424103.1 aldehyde dehydrogenase family protein [Elusimicrobiota bacterium]MBK9057707.1 aldehyde dehydrogenase family protein [Elusimicrobiota bacterium]
MPNESGVVRSGRREALRKNVKGLIVECLSKEDKAPSIGTAVDLSVEGLSFKLIEDSLDEGDKCRLTLHLLFPKSPIPIEGTIVWKRPLMAGGVSYGLKITSIQPDQLELEEMLTAGDSDISVGLDRRGGDERRTSKGNKTLLLSEKRDRVDRRQQPQQITRLIGMEGPRHFFRDLFDESSEEPLQGYSPVPLKIKSFPLYIGGKAFWTGKDEYFPYVEQAILDFEKTRSVLGQVKLKQIPPDVNKYIFARYAVGDDNANKEAMRAAADAAHGMRALSLQRRTRILKDIHDLLIEKKKELIELMVAEGHPVRLAEWEYLGMESSYRKETLDFFSKEMSKEMKSMNGESIYLVRKPDGVVCVSPPKNAPASISLFAGFCLLPGNSLVIKPPLRVPIACTYLWSNIVQRAAKANGAPDGCINIVNGNSQSITKDWMESPLVNDIFYFGDSEKGMEIGAQAFGHGKKPILELSGNDFMVVWADAPLREAAESLVEGFLGSMQICMAPKKAIVHPAVYNRFLDIFVPMVEEKVRVGLPSDPKVYLTPVARLREFHMVLQETMAKGAKVLSGGRRLNHLGEPDARGQFAEATLVSIRDIEPMRFECVSEENFFPLMPLVTLPSQSDLSDRLIFEWMVSVLAKNKFGLRTSVWTRSKIWASRFANEISNSGMLRINSPHLGFTPYFAPNGGPGKSGGPYGEMNFPWLKSSHLQGVSVRWGH